MALTPMGLLHRALTLCVSMCGACEHLTVSHTGAQGRKPETRDLEMIPGRLLSPSPHAAEPPPHLCPNLPLRTFLSASGSLSARVSLRLQSALPFLPGDVSSHGQHLSDPQIMSFIPSLILCKFLGNSNPAETSPGQSSRHCIQDHSVSIPKCPEPLELDPMQLSEQMMQFLSDPCVR